MPSPPCGPSGVEKIAPPIEGRSERTVPSTDPLGVDVFRTSESLARALIVYQPRILIVGHRWKRTYLGGQIYRYDPYNYLVLSVPLPAECETEAIPEEPLLLLAINVESAMLGEILLEMHEPSSPAGPTPRGIASTPMTEELGGAVVRLLIGRGRRPAPGVYGGPARQPHPRPPDSP